MDQSWLLSAVYGMLSGFTEFLPVSAEAHQRILFTLTGAQFSGAVQLMSRIGVLAALLISCRPRIEKLRRERRLAALAPKKRKRHPDAQSIADIRILSTAIFPVLLSLAAYLFFSRNEMQLWLVSALLIGNGIFLYVPQFLPRGNKGSRALSALDAILIGIGGGLGVVPGISRITGVLSISMIRGCDQTYALDLGLLLSIPALVVLMLLDAYILLISPAAISAALILSCVLSMLAAFAGAYFGIVLMRFLAVRIGHSGFAYYSWGAALFLFLLYLTI